MRDWLKTARDEKGYTMAQMGEKIGISESYYSLIERGERQKNMDITLVCKLSEIFSIPIDEIIRKEAT